MTMMRLSMCLMRYGMDVVYSEMKLIRGGRVKESVVVVLVSLQYYPHYN